eukprot:6473865-Alexandrium_andersonii.AAC.1
MEAQACRRRGPKGRSRPEHFYCRYTDWTCKPKRRPATGWPVELLQGQVGLHAYISILQEAG